VQIFEFEKSRVNEKKERRKKFKQKNSKKLEYNAKGEVQV